MKPETLKPDRLRPSSSFIPPPSPFPWYAWRTWATLVVLIPGRFVVFVSSWQPVAPLLLAFLASLAVHFRPPGRPAGSPE